MTDLPHISSSTFNKKIIIHDNLDEDKELLDLLNGKTLPASSSSRKRPMILPDPIPEEEESTITLKRKFTYDLPTISMNKFKQTYKKKEKKSINELNLYHSVNFSQHKKRPCFFARSFIFANSLRYYAASIFSIYSVAVGSLITWSTSILLISVISGFNCKSASTVVLLTGDNIKVLREGEITLSQINEVLKNI